jgi:hypothetical protein
VVAEQRRSASQRPENLDLHCGVGDMVLAADDMGDAHVDVVDDRGQRTEKRAVLARQHRIGQRRAVDVARPSRQIVPSHDFGVELEAPMRTPSLRLESGALFRGKLQRGAIIDRRQAARLLALAPPIQFLGRLIGRIKPPHRL